MPVWQNKTRKSFRDHERKGEQNVKKRRILSIFLLLAMIAGLFTGCTAKDTPTDHHTFETLADFKTAKIGIMTGSSHDTTAKEMFPDAERVYFNTVADMVLATEQGKIDGYIEDAPFLFSVLWEGANVQRLDESIKKVDNGFAFPQSEESRALRE
jgi:polar amino acid transport system substrate-binding protein